MTHKFIVISYTDTLNILRSHAGYDKLEKDTGLGNILFILLQSFLCEQSKNAKETNLLNLLEYYGLNDFETSEIGTNVSNSIIEITSMFFPGFRSYDSSLYLNINDIQHINDSDILVALPEDNFNIFTKRSTGFLNARPNHF